MKDAQSRNGLFKLKPNFDLGGQSLLFKKAGSFFIALMVF